MLSRFLVYGKVEFVIYAVIVVASMLVSGYIYKAQVHDPLPPPLPPPSINEPLDTTAPPTFNRLAILDNQQRLWIADPETGDRRPLSLPGQECRTPMWSRDGSHLAYVQLWRTEILCVRAAASDNDVMSTLKSIRYEEFRLLNWSPDGRYLVYMKRGSRPDKTVLLGVTPETPSFVLEEAHIDGIQWSDDSHGLRYVHDDSLHRVSVTETLDTQDVSPTEGMIKNPAWAAGPDQQIQVVSQGGAHSLALGSTAEGVALPMYPLDGPVVLAPSPDRSRLALVEKRENSLGPATGPVTVVSLVDSRPAIRFPRAAGAVFWSPDSTHLALYVDDTGEPVSEPDRYQLPGSDRAKGRAQWWIMNTDTGTCFPLVSCYPSYSHGQLIENASENPGVYQIWNPAGTELVVATSPAEADRSDLWIIDVFGDAAPRAFGEGHLAVWSWQ